MRWGVCLVALAALAGALVLGHWLGRDREQEAGKRRALWTVGLCLLVVLTRALLPQSLEFALFPGDLYPIVRPWWSLPFALCLLAAGAGQLEGETARKGLLVLAALLFVSAAHRLARTALFDPRDVVGRVGEDGVCVQTTDYTCGAAAAATLLAHHGVASSERELAELCWTNAVTGTDVFGVARGLRRKLAGTGREVRLEWGDWERLRALGEPAMVTVRFALMIDHWVVVREVRGDVALVGDPLHGVREVPREEFLRDWRRGILWTPRTGPAADGAPVGAAPLGSAR